MGTVRKENGNFHVVPHDAMCSAYILGRNPPHVANFGTCGKCVDSVERRVKRNRACPE